jgi:energy-coupling factor transporter ATP-binding protein EcfA2
LVQSGRCDCYVLLTNAGVSGAVAEDIETLFQDGGIKQFVIFGSTWICQTIRENKRLRMLVPRLYGLGDLSQILDERAYQQAKALLASMREDLSKVVLTAAYRRGADALDKHGFVLLVGEPAAGKTTIASMLSMAALDQWGCSTLKLDDPGKVIDHWNPDEPSQFFWIDDAFGVMQYESYLAHSWNHVLPQVKTMLRKGTKVVMTTRDYIYRRARNDLKESAFPLLNESQVVIDVHDLSLEERRQILYNHIKLGRQSKVFRTKIKPHLEAVAGNTRFVPETARRLGDPAFTKDLVLSSYHLNKFVETQEQFLREVLLGLDADSKAALALIFMRNNLLESPIELEESEREAIDRLGSSIGKCIKALDALNGSFVQFVYSDEMSSWRFKHPTVGDAYAALLLQNPELLGIYVKGSPIDQLMDQITCGEIGLERAVALPKVLFPLVLKRLDEFLTSSTTKYKTPLYSAWHRRDRLETFLAFRCSKEFLSQYIDANPDILNRVASPGLLLNSVSEVDLAIRLNKFGLLPEDSRKRFVRTVTSYALEGEDLYALESQRIQSVFTEDELSDFRARVRSELLPKLSDVRYDWQSNHDSSSEADGYMEPLIDSFKALKVEFVDEPEIVDEIERQIQFAEQWIADHTADESRPDRRSLTLGEADNSRVQPNTTRGIFDDIDA